ncbi:unnamed protein product [Symbiodinium sp. CCMP2592]|nr:unnamed protein product [Symbiodinium sp. CCMP2592]
MSFAYGVQYPGYAPAYPVSYAPVAYQPQPQAAQPQAQPAQAAQAYQALGFAAPAQAQSAKAAPAESSGASRLVVSGCRHETVAQIVRGHFTREGENHGHPVFKKESQWNGLDVMIYFWDERDGPSFSGWWFGPKVGGDQVWAYQPDKESEPPASGWRVPYDGPVDNTFILYPAPGAAPTPTPTPAAYNPNPTPTVVPPPASYASAAAAPAVHTPSPWDAQQAALQAQQAAQQAQQREREQREREQREREMREMQERQQHQMEERRKIEARKAEEMRRREAEALQRKELEKAQKAQQEKAQQELEKRRLEQRSVLAIRRQIQKVRIATPETLDALEKELQDLLQTAAAESSLGSQADTVKEEAACGLEAAKKRCETLKEMKRKQHEEEEKAKAFLAELLRRLDHAEGAVKDLHAILAEHLEAKAEPGPAEPEPATSTTDEKFKPFPAAVLSGSLRVESLVKAMELAQSARSAARKVEDAAVECGTFAQANSKLKEELKDSAEAAEVLRKVPLYLLRLQAAQQTSEAYVQATLACEKNMRRREESKREAERRSALFRSFDRDGDGRLQEAEALQLARTLLSQTETQTSASKVSEKSLKEIVRAALEEDGTVQSLSLLSSCVGSFREMQRDGRRRLAREARAKLLASLQSKWRRRVQELEASTGSQTEDTLKEVEAAVAPLLTETGSPPGQMQTRSKHCETLIQKGQEKAEDFEKKVQQLPVAFRKEVNSKQVKASELEEIMAPHQKRLALRLGRTGQRLERAKRLTELFRAKVARKENEAIDLARGKLASALRAYAKTQNFSAKQLFHSISDSDMTEEAFLELCRKAEVETAETELASKVFHRALPEDAETLPLSAFERLLRSFYKVMQQTPFTEEAEVSGDNAKVQLQSGQFLEALEPADPKEVDEVGERLRLRARDGSEGWATLAHLRPVAVGPAYALRRRSPLLETEDLKSESKELLLEGDVVELFKEEGKELLDDKEAKLKVVFGSVRTRSGKYGWIAHSDQVLQPL